MLIATCTCIYTRNWMHFKCVHPICSSIHQHMVTHIHDHHLIISQTDTLWYTIMHHPVCVARVYVWLCEQKNCSAINKTKNKKKMFDTGMKLKKEKKRKSRFIARLRSTLSRTCCCVCLSLWEIYTVYCSCSLYGTTIPDPEPLRQFLLISIILS